MKKLFLILLCFSIKPVSAQDAEALVKKVKEKLELGPLLIQVQIECVRFGWVWNKRNFFSYTFIVRTVAKATMSTLDTFASR